jgi:hypothetical protein
MFLINTLPSPGLTLVANWSEAAATLKTRSKDEHHQHQHQHQQHSVRGLRVFDDNIRNRILLDEEVSWRSCLRDGYDRHNFAGTLLVIHAISREPYIPQADNASMYAYTAITGMISESRYIIARPYRSQRVGDAMAETHR